MDGFVHKGESSFKMLGLTSLLNWIEIPNIIFIAQTASKKIGALTRSMKFIFPEVALYLYKSNIRSCKKHCCHVWADPSSCYLELLDKIKQQKFRTVVISLAASLENLANRRNVASLSLF